MARMCHPLRARSAGRGGGSQHSFGWNHMVTPFGSGSLNPLFWILFRSISDPPPTSGPTGRHPPRRRLTAPCLSTEQRRSHGRTSARGGQHGRHGRAAAAHRRAGDPGRCEALAPWAGGAPLEKAGWHTAVRGSVRRGCGSPWLVLGGDGCISPTSGLRPP